MIYGIGIDTEFVGRIGQFVAEHESRITRVFTAGERRRAEKFAPERRARIYARMFAGKEAVMKSLGTGWNETVEWSEIETPLEDFDATAKLTGASKRLAEKLGVARIYVSLAATKKTVTATAIAERD